MSGGSFGLGGGIANAAWDDIFGEEEGEENEYDDERFPSNKDSIIFLIDTQPSMFEPIEDNGEIPFHNALRCAIATLTDKIISSENDLVGVCLYGTGEKKNLNDFESIYVLQDLDVPDAHRIIELEAILKKKESPFKYAEKEFPLADALWNCSSMFSCCNVRVGHKRVFLFTNDDSPNENNQHFREQAIQRAADLTELGIEVELLSMNKNGHTFDPMKFYQHIVSFDDDEDTGVLRFDAASKFEELRDIVRRKEFKKRAMGRIPFTIGTDVEIAVRLYNLVQETKKGSFVWLDKKNQPLKTLTKWVCADTGSLLMDTQIKHFTHFGGERVIFDKEELNQIKTIDTPGLRLMGFKPRNTLKPYLNVKHATFIYPDEHTIKGSTLAFAALLDRMLALDKVAIARLTARTNVAPRFVALLPQAETFDAEGSQTFPSGLHVIPLPFADDIRVIKIDSNPNREKPSVSQIEKAKRMVKKLRIKFNSSNFLNPSLQKHYANLQALALDRDTVDETFDLVVPDLEGMDKFKDLIEDFKHSVFPDNYEEMKGSKGTGRRKRNTEDDDGEGGEERPRSKRTKFDPAGDPEERNKDVLAYLAQGKLDKLTVSDLKLYLQSKGVKALSKDRKDDLIAKVKQLHGDD